MSACSMEYQATGYPASDEFCEKLHSQLVNVDYDALKISPILGKQKKVFVGNLRKPKREDFNLWVSSYDMDNSGKKDLVAIDWHPRGKNTFYLAVYAFKEQGEIFNDRKRMKNYIKQVKLSGRHERGEDPIFKEKQMFGYHGEEQEVNFVGYHYIQPVKIEDKTYVMMKNDKAKKSRVIIFDASLNNSVNLICSFE